MSPQTHPYFLNLMHHPPKETKFNRKSPGVNCPAVKKLVYLLNLSLPNLKEPQTARCLVLFGISPFHLQKNSFRKSKFECKPTH